MVKMSQIAEIIAKHGLTDLLDTWDYKKLQQEIDFNTQVLFLTVNLMK